MIRHGKKQYYYREPGAMGSVTRFFHPDEVPLSIMHGGKEMFLDRGGVGGGGVVGVGEHWNIKSYGAGVARGQVDEAMADSVKIGIPTQFDRKTGQAVFTSREHRRKYMAAKGLTDLEGGYGDYTGK